MGKALHLVTAIAAIIIISSCGSGRTAAEKQGFKLAVQSYTFHKFTFEEALDKTASLGVKYIEAYPGHRLSEKWGDAVFGPQMTDEQKKDILKLASDKGVKIVGSGVYTPSVKDIPAMFAFAKEMGLEYVTCEPALEDWDLVEDLSQKYGIKVAVHNHPKPSLYWHPDSLLSAISQRGPQLGSCADVGHWRRMGLDQIECLNKLGPRVLSAHFKDIEPLHENGDWQEDVIWGTGILDVKGMLAVLKDIGFNGYLAIEYEFNWENSVPDIRSSIDYFNSACEEMGK